MRLHVYVFSCVVFWVTRLLLTEPGSTTFPKGVKNSLLYEWKHKFHDHQYATVQFWPFVSAMSYWSQATKPAGIDLGGLACRVLDVHVCGLHCRYALHNAKTIIYHFLHWIRLETENRLTDHGTYHFAHN